MAPLSIAFLQCWEELQDRPDFEAEVGKLMFQKVFATTEGRVKLERFGHNIDNPKMYDGERFVSHAKHIFRTLDRTIRTPLEDGRQELNDELVRLGRLHFHFKVTHRLYPVLATSLIEALRTVIGEDKFTRPVENGFSSMISHITSGYMEGAFYEEFDQTDKDDGDDSETMNQTIEQAQAPSKGDPSFVQSLECASEEVWA